MRAKAKKPAEIWRVCAKSAFSGTLCLLFLPSAFFVTVRLEALPAFMLRHLQPSFLFQIAHRFIRFGGRTCGLPSLL